MRLLALLLLSITLLPGISRAGTVTETRVEYRQGDATMIGYLYAPGGNNKKIPAVLVFPDWMGQGEFSRHQARELAEHGYVGFAADVYGGEKRAKDAQEAGTLAGAFKKDRALFRARAQAAFDTVAKLSYVDPGRIAAIGFCFGGTAALELARNGAPLSGVVSFHGGLDTPDPALAKNIKGAILALHGADDPYVPESEVRAFESEMRQAKVQWELIKYGGAVHAFTNPDVGTDPAKGAAYNPQVAARAFHEMWTFFTEHFGQPGHS